MSRAGPDMVNRLLADHIEVAGLAEAGVAAGSEILTVQALRIEEIGEVVRPRMGVVQGHGDAEAGRAPR